MVCESHEDLPKFEKRAPGTRSIVRRLLAIATACLLTAPLLVAYLRSSLPLSPQDLTVASDSRKLLSSNMSEQAFGPHNASDKQLAGPGSGTWEPGIPVVGLCINTQEVTNIVVCNYGATRILPHTSQLAGSSSVYWALQGDWIVTPQCYRFDAAFINRHGAENIQIQCAYMREGEHRWNTCAGGNFKYKRSSPCVGEYRCAGHPVVCTQLHSHSFPP